MKKTLKALFLCALTSLVMFAVVYASPISVQAVPSTTSDTVILSTVEIVDAAGNTADTVNTPVTIDFEYPYGMNPFTIDSSNSAFYFEPGYGYLIVIYFDNSDLSVLDASMLQNVTASFSFSYNGVNYSETKSLEFASGNCWLCDYLYGDSNNSTGYGAQINDLKNHIGNISKDATLTGENRVIEFNVGTALPKSVISTLANSENVTLKFTFVYEGYEFCTTITSEAAKKVYNPKVEWAGPCYLADNFPTVWTGKTVK